MNAITYYNYVTPCMSRTIQYGVGPHAIATRPRWKSITLNLASDHLQSAFGFVVGNVMYFNENTQCLSGVRCHFALKWCYNGVWPVMVSINAICLRGVRFRVTNHISIQRKPVRQCGDEFVMQRICIFRQWRTKRIFKILHVNLANVSDNFPVKHPS